MSDVFRPTKIAGAIALLLVAIAFAVGAVSERLHIGPGLGSALATATADAEFRVRVEFPFKPEGFHFTFLQRFGIVAGADDTSVTIRRVRPDGVREIASQYWVRSIELAQ